MNLKVARTITKTTKSIFDLNDNDLETIIKEYFMHNFPDEDIQIKWGHGQLPSAIIILTSTSIEDNSL